MILWEQSWKQIKSLLSTLGMRSGGLGKDGWEKIGEIHNFFKRKSTEPGDGQDVEYKEVRSVQK